MNLFDRWTELPPARRRLLAQAAVAVPVATAAVWSFGTSRAREVMPRLPWRLRPEDETVDVGWAVEAVGRRVPGARCLARAVAAEAILDRGGRAPEVRIGARRDTHGGLEAHAWVEVDGRVVVGAAERAAFTSLEPPTGLST
jgi:Transglutaminase-like superfamily